MIYLSILYIRMLSELNEVLSGLNEVLSGMNDVLSELNEMLSELNEVLSGMNGVLSEMNEVSQAQQLAPILNNSRSRQTQQFLFPPIRDSPTIRFLPTREAAI